MTEFFEGTREVGRTTINEPTNGNTECVVTARWEPLLSRTLDCGSQWRHKIVKTHGVTQERREEIEAVTKAALGVKYLTNLEMQITAKVGRSVTLNHVSTEESEFVFEVPNCFRRTYEIFQLRYDVRMSCEWKPRLRKKRFWQETVSTSTNDIHQRSQLTPWYEQCGCRPDHPGPDTGLLQVIAPDITLREPYIVTDEGLHLHTVGISVRPDGIVSHRSWTGHGGFELSDEIHDSWRRDRSRFERELLAMLVEHPHWLTYGVFPKHLQFLSGHTADEPVRVEFREIHENRLEAREPLLAH